MYIGPLSMLEDVNKNDKLKLFKFVLSRKISILCIRQNHYVHTFYVYLILLHAFIYLFYSYAILITYLPCHFKFFTIHTESQPNNNYVVAQLNIIIFQFVCNTLSSGASNNLFEFCSELDIAHYRH